jgi:hypothetical protein
MFEMILPTKGDIYAFLRTVINEGVVDVGYTVKSENGVFLAIINFAFINSD